MNVIFMGLEVFIYNTTLRVLKELYLFLSSTLYAYKLFKLYEVDGQFVCVSHRSFEYYYFKSLNDEKLQL